METILHFTIQGSLMTAIFCALLGNALAWAFDPFQWVKDKVVPVSWMLSESRIKQIAWKLLNCGACLSWWTCIASIAFTGLVLQGIVSGIAAFTISGIINQIRRD